MADPLRPTVRRRRLGRELRRLREDRGLTLEAAARRLDRTFSSLSKIERGMQGLRQGELAFILDQYGVGDENLRRALLTLRKDANKKGWWLDYKGRIEPSLLDYISLESDASAIRTFEALHLPGLLQTTDYARAIIGSGVPGLTPRRVDELISIRTARQRLLQTPRPVLWSVVDEAVLHRPFGGREVMRDQLCHLLQISQRGCVTLQVLPFAAGAHPGKEGPFTLLDVGDRGELMVVLIESLTLSWYLEEDEDIHRYKLVFDHLCAAALSPADSLALIERVMSRL
ncbi:helix-turn-helix domain-containing protein [Actinomadura alba]|uniref:Helix-turn-helix transcriptional regulator n=1 Tax=Actinomadura alba TaxID=406431 RepID=A0ABR7M263_9ACTN|nr:helix-turn-helix transcriptional regulator [Actinomadura alba]MBC6470668.1 helix-turn-helix transcriptional regulator [Actinomadura alba]